jgi:delta14-sterol reductase
VISRGAMDFPFLPFAETLLPSLGLVVGFVVVLFLFSMILPGRLEIGVPHQNEHGETVRIEYVMNGLFIYLLVAVVLIVGIATRELAVGALLRHFWGLFFWANVLSFAASGALQWAGYRARGRGAQGGQSLRDYFMGVQLSPSLFGIDLKMFSYKPSLIGLFVLNLSFAAYQIETEGRLTNAMLLYEIFTGLYVLNYFHFEHGMVFTWDIIAERFGWMLVWGDYAFVPFAYSVIGWYLLLHPVDLPAWIVVLAVALFISGLSIFRGANEQKDWFKRDPSRPIWGKPPESIQGRVLTSGFWGIGRKLNYSGEIMLYTSWALLSGFVSPVPFLLPVWLFCLLTHRAWRDEQKCREKYGPLWEAYCKKATFRMIPIFY